ncbi:phage major capsid protein, HK97 family [Hartmannibacter diazotrophicus]|uniref:Phage major capsid protein, HK97 family n=1 Tax=Hartmannibacter diazotrophicus TaxID=1482074 RepID=A0A2C9D541_9HYPH|nr:phage major capsid protein [Hartmannibacter diazotrophicus]SON54881.1 phage major capsid protein, HK97 family [Hartmannibacter diazotrophicus]
MSIDDVTPSARAGSEDVSAAFNDFMSAFEDFRSVNDARLGELERRAVDPLTVEKLERIERALDERKADLDRLTTRALRPPMGGQRERGAAAEAHVLEHRDAFHAYMRSGADNGLKSLEAKALSVGSGPDGGYLVPDETEAEIGRRLAALSPIRALSTVRTVSSATYKKPFSISGPAVGWVGETAARPQTGGPTLAELTYPTMELYAMPAATQTLLDDAAVDVDAWLADEIEQAFAAQEGTAFVTGDGSSKPTGFLSVTTVAEESWAWGKLGYVLTGASGAFASASPADALVDLVYSLKAGYRQNANFVLNRSTQAAVRKLKDADGNYLWQPPATADGRASLLSFPVAEVEDMPDIGANMMAIAFGDFRRGYLVVDRTGVRVLRDPYSAKPYVLFYTTKRVGGGVQDFDAIKLLKFGTA